MNEEYYKIKGVISELPAIDQDAIYKKYEALYSLIDTDNGHDIMAVALFAARIHWKLNSDK